MKYGLFGGSFDPPHLGHMQIARAALEALDLDEVIWIPAYINPHKGSVRTDARKRLEMCKLAITGEENMSVSDIEITRKGPSYLYDTLGELRLVMPGEYWFIAGADALKQFDMWKEPEKILLQCRIALHTRPGTDLETTLGRLGKEVRERIDLIETTPKAISSSNIRDMAFSGDSIEHLVSPAVHNYIVKTGLYND